MAAVYPGGGARYTRHVDNPGGHQGNGRILTILLYLNHNWQEQDGGELVLYPGGGEPVSVSPLYNRWRRNAHACRNTCAAGNPRAAWLGDCMICVELPAMNMH